MKSHDDVVQEVNHIACELLRSYGCEVDENLQCYLSTDPEIARCWNAAAVAYFNTVMRNCPDIDVQQYLRELLPVSAPPKLTLIECDSTVC